MKAVAFHRMLNQNLMQTCCCFEWFSRHTKIANVTHAHTHVRNSTLLAERATAVFQAGNGSLICTLATSSSYVYANDISVILWSVQKLFDFTTYIVCMVLKQC